MNIETIWWNAKKKAWEIKHDAEIKFNEAKNWCIENKEFCLMAAPVIFAGGKHVLNAVKKTKQEKLVRDQENRVWDPEVGYHWKLKRPLSNEEMAYLNYMHDEGFARYEILKKMNVLK